MEDVYREEKNAERNKVLFAEGDILVFIAVGVVSD